MTPPGETPLKQAAEPAEAAPATQADAPVAQTAAVAEAKADAADASVEKAADAAPAAGGPPDEDGLRQSLQKVVDPELHMNIIELGLVYKVDVIDNGNPAPDVEIEMTLTSPGCPYGPMILGQIPPTIKGDYGDRVGEVNVGLTFTPPWDPATMASEDVQFELGIF